MKKKIVLQNQLKIFNEKKISKDINNRNRIRLLQSALQSVNNNETAEWIKLGENTTQKAEAITNAAITRKRFSAINLRLPSL